LEENIEVVKMKEVKALVLRTAGTNCQEETMWSLKLAGFKVSLMHVNQLIKKPSGLFDFQLMVIPGGFSHGDYLGSAKIMANKLKFKLCKPLLKFIEEGNLLWGICNGFQALIKMGVLPGFKKNYSKQMATLSFNASGHFQDEWVYLENKNKGKCIYSKGVKKIFVPINHGEGRFICSEKVYKKLLENDQLVFSYSPNPNGSMFDIAGICDETGRVFGLMPHPEKNWTSLCDPRSTRTEMPAEGEGLVLFKNAFTYAKKHC
jgi:phosphoribosylformylglycinamidine synthase